MIPLPPFSTGLLTKAVTWEQANNVSARFPTIVRTRLDSVLNANIINAGATACETIVRRKIKNQQIPLPAHTRRIQAPQNQINDDIAVPEQGCEKTPNACDTPGFQLRSDHAITRDDRDFLKLEMKRNNLRMIQTPLNVLRGWRGNCDIKVLLCDCHDSEPTPEDIAEVTDYVVAYACKGNETLATERDTITAIVNR